MNEPIEVPLLSRKAACGWALVAVGAFHVAYLVEAAGGLIVFYLAALFALAWAPSSRWAFYLGLAIGIGVAGPQLWFFQRIFGPAAVALWAVLGVWLGLFLLLSRAVVIRWPQRGAWWIPVIWFGFEYARSELYYLRFAWLTPGFSLSHPYWIRFACFGVYGFSFVVLLALAKTHVASRRRGRVEWEWLVAALLMFGVCAMLIPAAGSHRLGPYIVGIQLEGATESQTLAALDESLRDHEEVELLVLSEYAFDGPIPTSVTDWCRQHRKHLIAGGKDPVDGGASYRNTAFVISPDGEIVFKQAKAVPVQFMADGLPATEQNVWKSPWGKIGIAICYDLSYARVIDQLIEAGAQGLIVPTMDNEEWGAHEHWLHTKISPVRAHEYNVPIFRLASSGISQLVARDGEVLATAPFPGQDRRLVSRRTGEFAPDFGARLPLDRYLAIPGVVATVVLAIVVRLWRMPAAPRIAAPGRVDESG